MGRPKGSKNKHTFQVEEIARRFDKEPFEILMMVANGDWEGLGFKAETRTVFTPQGIEMEEDNVPLRERTAAAKEAAKYLYSAKQAVQVTAPEGIRVIIEDFCKAK